MASCFLKNLSSICEKLEVRMSFKIQTRPKVLLLGVNTSEISINCLIHQIAWVVFLWKMNPCASSTNAPSFTKYGS